MTDKYSNELGLRFKERYDELKWLYYELYNNDELGFEYLCGLIKEYYSDRSEEQKQLDREPEKAAERLSGNGAVGMELYIDRFAGDLKGAAKEIDYFGELGISLLRVMPVFESPKERGDGGFAVSDYRRVRAELGTTDDLRRFIKKCRGRGISCCLDLVLSRTSDEHEWAKAARAGDEQAKSRYHFFDSWDIPNGYECTMQRLSPDHGSFTQLDSGEVVMTSFHPNQWDLNYSNPMVFNDMAENMLFLANLGVDIIRPDGAPYLWKELGTTCRDLPQAHNIMRMLHIILEIVCPSVMLLTDAASADEAQAYFSNYEKPEFDMIYNTTTGAGAWNTLATRDVRLLKRQTDRLAQFPGERVVLNYLRNHDEIGWNLDYDLLRELGMEEISHKKFLNDYFIGRFEGSPSRGELYNDSALPQDARVCGTAASLCGIEAALWEKDDNALSLAVKADIMLHAFLFTQSGIPMIYSGDEVGQLNDYLYRADINKRFDSRNLHRGRIDRESAKMRSDPDSYQGRIFKAIRRLGEVRAENEVFKPEAEFYSVGTGSSDVLGLCRRYNGRKLLALFNFCEQERTVSFEHKRVYTNLMTGEKHTKKYIDLEPYGFVWVMIK